MLSLMLIITSLVRYGGFEFISKLQVVGGNISDEITEFLENFVNSSDAVGAAENFTFNNLQTLMDGWKAFNLEEQYLVRVSLS